MSTLSSYSLDKINLILDVFIETGTCRAESLLHAMNAGFKECHSIEIDPSLHQEAQNRVGDRPDIKLHLGHSPDVLKTIINPIKTTTFWLDAHYSGGPKEENNSPECPLLEELAVINSFKWDKSPIIIIDDSHMYVPEKWSADFFPAHLFKRSDWPTLEQIQAALPGYDICHLDYKLYCLPKM